MIRATAVLLIAAAIALLVGHALGVPWRTALVVLLVAIALLLAPYPRRPS